MRQMLPLLGLAAGLATIPGHAQEPIEIGVAAPLSGPSAILGLQIAAGAGEAAGERATVIAADTACTAEGGAAAASEFVRSGVDIVVGFLCTEEIEAALPILSEAGIPVLDVGVRAQRLTDRREREGHLVWRIAPRSDGEAEALADFVREEWRDVPFGIVEDGSAYARDLADEVRARLGPEGIEPALVDNYRPAEERQFALARRIGQSGVTRLLAFGTRADIAILARDAAELGLDLDIVGGESLLDEPAAEATLPDGTLALAPDDGAATYPDASGATVREGYHAPAYAAAEIAIAAVEAATADGGSVASALDTRRFSTVLGPIGFTPTGDSDRDAFAVLSFDGTRFVRRPG